MAHHAGISWGPVIANGAACVAAGAALAALVFAWLTVREARAARTEAERDQLRHRLERVSDLLDRVAALARMDIRYQPPHDSWLSGRNLLRHALVGLHRRLPRCAAILAKDEPDQALALMNDALAEVEAELARLEAKRPGESTT